MNVMRTMPLKSFALSKRDNTRRHSFSQPIRRSGMMRLRYALDQTQSAAHLAARIDVPSTRQSSWSISI